MKNLDRIIKNIIRETTGDSSGSRGSYVLPMQPGLRPWSKTSLDPYTQSVSDYDSPLFAYLVIIPLIGVKLNGLYIVGVNCRGTYGA